MKDLIKSKFLLIIALLITILALSIPAYAKYSGGSGEPNDPYLIYTAEQMNEIGDEPNDWDKHFKLMIDIDLSIFTGKDFNIIGIDRDDSFVGFFDGNRHVISNFNFITTDNNFIGLFRFVGQEGEIKDLGLINSSIDGGSGYGIGSLVGENHGNITNCYVKDGRVSGYWDVGGLVGSNNGIITDCCFSGKVSGSNGAGGLVGANYEGTISKCSTRGYVSGEFAVGGLVGDNPAFDVSSRLINCYSSIDVSGGKYVGGLAGGNGWSDPGNHFTEIMNCYSIGKVSGNDYVGGLVGYNIYETGSIIASFWNIESSGQTKSDGGTGKTTAEMQTASTFLEAGWDFLGETENGDEDVWWIDEGQDYPRLWWETSSDWFNDDVFFLVVDDFESYNDLNPEDPASNRIYLTWIDGWEDPTNGSIVGCIGPMPYCWPRIHSGMQSMPILYDNSIGISVATADIDNLEIGRDWTIDGVDILTLWFHGKLGNASEPMFVALANDNGTTGVSHHDNPDAAQIEKWTEWRIDLHEFTAQGVDLSNIGTISIGFGNKNNPQAGGKGHVKFDDIRLYRSTSEPAP